jgi:hypothetical protein
MAMGSAAEALSRPTQCFHCPENRRASWCKHMQLQNLTAELVVASKDVDGGKLIAYHTMCVFLQAACIPA